MNLENIIDAVRHNRIRITDYADEEAQADNLSFEEIFISVLQGEIIEDYPDDEPYQSCLIYGETFSKPHRNFNSTGCSLTYMASRALKSVLKNGMIFYLQYSCSRTGKSYGVKSQFTAFGLIIRKTNGLS